MRIKIGSNPVRDISEYNLYLVKSDSILACNVKESNIVITDFPEESGDVVYVSPTPSLKSFDYSISLVYFGDMETGNSIISSFYTSMLGKQVVLYNVYKNIKLTGYVKSYKAGDFYRNERDVIIFELTFYIPRPQDCKFDYLPPQIYYGTSNSGTIIDMSKTSSKGFTINIPVGATNVVFAWDATQGEPTSVVYPKFFNYDVKGIFTKSSKNIQTDDGLIPYNVYTYTPAVPFSTTATYIIN